MKYEDRRVLILVDNASSHCAIDKSKYPNVVLEYLSTNTTSHLKPMHTGIIKKCNLFYKKLLVKSLLEKLKEKKVLEMLTVFEAIQFFKSVWGKVCSTTVINCWQHCGISSNSSSRVEIESLPFLTNEFNDWRTDTRCSAVAQ